MNLIENTVKEIRKKVKGVVLLLANVIEKFICLKSKQYLTINKWFNIIINEKNVSQEITLNNLHKIIDVLTQLTMQKEKLFKMIFWTATDNSL